MKRNRSNKKNLHVWPRVSHLRNENFCVNTALCMMLAWVKSFKCEKLCQLHQTGPQQEQRDCLLGSLPLDQTSVWRPEGQKCLSDYQMSQMWHTSACRVQTNLFGNLGSLGDWTLGSTNVERGLNSPFPVQTKLDKVTPNYQLLCTSSQEPIFIRGITSVYGQRCSRASSKSGFLHPFLVPKPHNHWRPIVDLSKPNLLETIRTTLQQWEWVTSIDFNDAYFHVPIQEQPRTYQI